MKKLNNKHYSMIALIVSFIVLALFLLLGLVLSIFFIQNLFIGLRGFGLMQILFFIIGIYLVYRPAVYIRFLIKNRKKFDKIFNKFVEENKISIIITAVSSIVLLFLFYSSISANFDFYVNVVLYLPIFLLNSLVFIANIFLLRYKLMFLTPMVGLILPISEVLFLFGVCKFITKLFKRKN